ncbi:hypothetical protein A8H37_17800 [Burkholderia thailandensis]|nr:hypothetical protein A8H37_17800 [Burkholderia thailandensis]
MTRRAADGGRGRSLDDAGRGDMAFVSTSAAGGFHRRLSGDARARRGPSRVGAAKFGRGRRHPVGWPAGAACRPTAAAQRESA